jgi:hypothetical protein
LPLFVLRKTTKTSTKMVNAWDEIWNREVRMFSFGPKRDLPKGTGHLGNLRIQEKGTRKCTLREYGLRLWTRSDCLWRYLDKFLW